MTAVNQLYRNQRPLRLVHDVRRRRARHCSHCGAHLEAFLQISSQHMAMDEKSAVVIGAGMVGVSCALYLQRAGHRVTLIDAHAPGSQTSFGNAATFASCIPVNHPKLLKNLPP